ncbi:3922_t:CDS:1 [Acaulospora colombiana]|uniref:3922_t:CDS:1 n=1 Tax=Acaulospora colombiana TaxID=27376 RepID=A0ACA9NWA5_9GLOM|nr:3922_t:CDS:1 [Acaulospora colombiana]
MSVVAPSPLPLVQLPGHRIPPYNNLISSYSAQRLALLGRARLQLAPPVQQPTHTSHPTNNAAQLSTSFNPISKPIDASSITSKPAQPELSSVARRKQQLAKSSVPTYAFGDANDNNQASPNIAIDSHESESTTHSISSSHQPTPARIGVVDIRFLTRQPPTVQKSPLQAPKSVSKESSVGSPNSPSAPLSAAAPKNQRPKTTTRVVSAAGSGKPSRSRPKTTATVDPDTSGSTEADKAKSKPGKHAFLFLPASSASCAAADNAIAAVAAPRLGLFEGGVGGTSSFPVICLSSSSKSALLRLFAELI